MFLGGMYSLMEGGEGKKEERGELKVTIVSLQLFEADDQKIVMDG
jgi:hypothetical protein